MEFAQRSAWVILDLIGTLGTLIRLVGFPWSDEIPGDASKCQRNAGQKSELGETKILGDVVYLDIYYCYIMHLSVYFSFVQYT